MPRFLLPFIALILLAFPAPAARSPSGYTAARNCLSYEAWRLLDDIERRFGPVQVISTCRPGARVAGTNHLSKHASGNAVDFRAGARKAAIVEWLAATHHKGGTMTYADKDHIHVDIGPRFVSLGSHDGRGQRKPRKIRKPQPTNPAPERKQHTPSGNWVVAAFHE